MSQPVDPAYALGLTLVVEMSTWCAEVVTSWSLWNRHVAPALDLPEVGLGTAAAVLVLRTMWVRRYPDTPASAPTLDEVSQSLIWRLLVLGFILFALLVSEVTP